MLTQYERNECFSRVSGGTRTCVVSTQRPGSETPEVATRLPRDGSACVSAVGGWGGGGGVSSLFCFLFKKPIVDVTGDAS